MGCGLENVEHNDWQFMEGHSIGVPAYTSNIFQGQGGGVRTPLCAQYVSIIIDLIAWKFQLKGQV